MALRKAKTFTLNGAVTTLSLVVIRKIKKMVFCRIFLAVLACLSISGCESAPTKISEADFPDSGLSFEIRTREVGAPAANSHQIYVKPLSNMDGNEVLVFDGIGGEIPNILHRGGNRYIIKYAGALRYEVWAEKQISISENSGRDRNRILFFEVNL